MSNIEVPTRKTILSVAPDLLEALTVDSDGEQGDEWGIDKAGRYYIDYWPDRMERDSEPVRLYMPAFLQDMLAQEYRRGKYEAKRAIQDALGIDPSLSRRVGWLEEEKGR